MDAAEPELSVPPPGQHTSSEQQAAATLHSPPASAPHKRVRSGAAASETAAASAPSPLPAAPPPSGAKLFDANYKEGLVPGRETALPLLLMAVTPLAALALAAFFAAPESKPVSSWIALPRAGYGTAATALAVFAVWQVLLMVAVPGRAYLGPPTRTGFRPAYTANGVACYLLSVAAFVALSDAVPGVSLGFFRASIAHDLYSQCIVLLCGVAFVLCCGLTLKAHLAPSPGEVDTHNHGLISQFFWGAELYPRVFGIDVKQFSNCRFGMMVWGIAPLSFLFTGPGGSMAWGNPALLASVALQIVYVFKFFVWEPGYMASMDIQHDRAGYYLVWGCICWVPAFYLLPARSLVDLGVKAAAPGPAFAIACAAAGLVCIWLNYQADAQRLLARTTGGRCNIWGAPARFIKASYTTQGGDTKHTLLLTSGWWGVARHSHYVFEILGALLWSCPAGFQGPLPFAYVIFLSVLLIDRAVRDDARCATKYGAAWDAYRQAVPWKVLPYVF